MHFYPSVFKRFGKIHSTYASFCIACQCRCIVATLSAVKSHIHECVCICRLPLERCFKTKAKDTHTTASECIHLCSSFQGIFPLFADLIEKEILLNYCYCISGMGNHILRLYDQQFLFADVV